jgi:glutamine synthetase
MSGFIERHGLWSPEQKAAAAEILKRVKAEKVEIIRLSFADQHGILRGKTVTADALPGIFETGIGVPITLIVKDTAHRTIYPVWKTDAGIAEMVGAGDVLLIPDPTTFRILPWTDGTGWILCDLAYTDGRAVPFATRSLAARAVERLAGEGYDYVSGLEVEFHLFRLDAEMLRPEDATQPGTPPRVSMVNQGFQYLTEIRMDEMEPLLDEMRRHLQALGLPVRTLEVEFGPSQFEITFAPQKGIGSADSMALFRSAARQICRRRGYHVSFMCRPQLANVFSSGWHLHQSLVDRKTGTNAFMPAGADEALSPLGRHFVAGLLRHAKAACVFTTPTINGYKRFRPYSLAPDRILWGRDNRGAMLRIVGGPGDPATRIENRVGEPAANPHLYLASQIVAGLEGMRHGLEPATPAASPYETEAERLPRSLMDALDALREDDVFATAMGQAFVDYYLMIKDAEVARFLSEVTDWEQREYFGIF